MLHSFRITLRHLSRQKLNTALHIIGLTLGLSVCLVIGLFLRYELSFDNYHNNADRIYRVNSVWIENENTNYHYSTPMPLAEALRNEVTGLEKVTRAHPVSNAIIEANHNKFLQNNILIIDPEFAEIFKLEPVKGDLRKALSKPYQAVLTEATAKKFFGTEEAVGKSFRFKNEFDIEVAAVVHDLPSNTHLPATLFLSYVPNQSFLGQQVDAWTFVSGTSTFILVPEGTTPDFSKQLRKIADTHINSIPDMPPFFKSDFDLQPLSAVHFDARYGGGGNWVQAVNTSWLWFFAGIGLMVLILACINFVNLSTAQALTRAKETGIRKSVGAAKGHLVFLFLSEAWTLVATSAILAIAIAQLSLPFINTLLEKGIALQLLDSPGVLMTLAAGVFVVGLLAGLYPAFVISRFNPIASLKGTFRTGDYGSSWLRKALVVSQFTISAGLLIVVILIAQQVNYLRSRNLGFNKENIILTELRGAQKVPAFTAELSRIPQVKDFTFQTGAPSPESWATVMTKTNENDPNRKDLTLLFGDEHYCTLYGFKLLSGRFPIASDTNSVSGQIPEAEQVAKVVVNEELVRALDLKSNEDALGKNFWMGMGPGKAEIVGVVANFNTNSLHSAIRPTVISSRPNVYGQAGIKIEANTSLPEALDAIKAAWEKVYPDGVFEFKFLDQEIDAMYKQEARLYTLFKVFAGLAMLISCLGLWGLATYSAQQRTKEIGIRKVLGASVNAMVVLLSREFIVMVAIALAISAPVAYYGMNNWLQTFAFRISIGWQVFIIAGVASLLIALLTVSFQAIKAARSNPVESLRNE